MSHTQCAHKVNCLLWRIHFPKPIATSKDGGLLPYFTASAPAWDAQLRICHCGCDRNISERAGQRQYRWTIPEGGERYAPVVTCWSIRIERAFNSAALRTVQKLAKQGPAR